MEHHKPSAAVLLFLARDRPVYKAGTRTLSVLRTLSSLSVGRSRTPWVERPSTERMRWRPMPARSSSEAVSESEKVTCARAPTARKAV